jgi:hypothetical protein
VQYPCLAKEFVRAVTCGIGGKRCLFKSSSSSVISLRWALSNGISCGEQQRSQWVESYVADDKTFCVYLAKDEAIIREHAAISGFPATKITAVNKMIDPTTEAA